MALTKRLVKGSALTHAEADANLDHFVALDATQQAAVNLKADAANAALTGTPSAPTASGATNTTQLATTAFVQTVVAAAVTGLLDLKTATDCSTNPNYPAALKGDAYFVSVAGRIGGASGKLVDVSDLFFATADNAGGTEASVGASWVVLEHNLVGVLLGSNNLSDVASAATARTNLGAAALAVAQAFTAGQRVTSVALADAANIATNAALSNKFRVTLAGNRTLDNPSNMGDGQPLQFRVIQDATGTRTLAYGSKFKWPGGAAPALTTAAAAVDLICCEYDGTSDTLICNISKDFK